MLPSGPIKMQPLFKIHPVLIQLGLDLQRLAAALAHLRRFFKKKELFLFLQLGSVFISLNCVILW